MSDKPPPITFMQRVQRDAMIKLLRAGGKTLACEITGWTIHQVNVFIDNFHITTREMGGFKPTTLPWSDKLRAAALRGAAKRKDAHDVDGG